MTSQPSHAAFLSERLGNYVVVHARRKAPRYDRQGREQNQVTRKQYAEVEREYRTLYGDPYDAVRASLYVTLREARSVISNEFGEGSALLDRIDTALEAEAGAR